MLGAALYDPIITSRLLSLADIAIAATGLLMLRTGRVSPLVVVVWCVAATVAVAVAVAAVFLQRARRATDPPIP